MKKVDILFVISSGLVGEIQVIKNEITAEATFDHICEGLGILDDLRSIDYGERLQEANILLDGSGDEIVWHSRVEINKYKN